MSTSATSIKNRTVVIADDDNVTRKLLQGILASIGLRVLGEASDGAKAMELMQKHKPEFVCLDIEMPQLTGLEVLAKIRESGSNVIVLIITGAATAENVRNAITGRADGIIAKPFNTARIISEMERALARSQAAKPNQPASAAST